MFKKCNFIPAFILCVSTTLIVSCGGGGGSPSSPGGTAQNGDVCSPYLDSGLSDGVVLTKLSPGQMPSDIGPQIISACSTGQFVFDGQCWDSVSINDATGNVAFKKSSESETILSYNQPYGAHMVDYLNKNSCDNSFPSSSCSQKASDYISLGNWLNLQGYSLWAMLRFNYFKPDSSSNTYLSDGDASIVLKTSFGECGGTNPHNYYQWYNNGTIQLNGSSYNLPLSEATFLSVYPTANQVQCSFAEGICYDVLKPWGKETLYFDESHTLFSYTIMYPYLK